MLIQNYHKVKSSFLSMEKDLSVFMDMMLGDNRLKKLLYYNTRDALDCDKLNDEQTMELVNKYIKIVPKLFVDSEILNYIIISFDDFTPNAKNPEFRDNLVTFHIICHFDQWQLQDFQLRPYKIAAEIDTMFNNKHFSGIGTLQFINATQEILSDEFGGFALTYRAIHGEDDRVGAPNPDDQAAMIEDFKEKPVRD